MDWVSFQGIGIGKIFLRDYLFTVFGLKIYWYSIIVVLGIISGICFSNLIAKKFGINKDTLFDVTVIGLIFGVIGLRLYYVVFNWKEFSSNLWSILEIQNGGLAIYGAIIFSFTSGFIYCKIKKINFLPIADVASICFLIGQCIGRWGNFFNIEAYGYETKLPWAMYSNTIENGTVGVHPTFFYESLWCFIGFWVLFIFIRYRKFDGQVFLNYIIWYGFGRFFIEGLRSDSLWLVENTLRVSQVLSFILFFTGVFVEVYVLFFYMKKHKDREFLYVKNLEKDKKTKK